MSKDLVTLIAETIQQLNTQQGLTIPAQLTGETTLFGKEGILDSVGLVSLVVAVEQAIEDEYGVSVSLADAKAMSQKHSPYRTLSSLAEYANRLIQEEK